MSSRCTCCSYEHVFWHQWSILVTGLNMVVDLHKISWIYFVYNIMCCLLSQNTGYVLWKCSKMKNLPLKYTHTHTKVVLHQIWRKPKDHIIHLFKGLVFSYGFLSSDSRTTFILLAEVFCLSFCFLLIPLLICLKAVRFAHFQVTLYIHSQKHFLPHSLLLLDLPSCLLLCFSPNSHSSKIWDFL